MSKPSNLDLYLETQSEWIGDLDFEDNSRVHNWRNYVPSAIKESWGDLSKQEKLLIAIVAQEAADKEEWD